MPYLVEFKHMLYVLRVSRSDINCNTSNYYANKEFHTRIVEYKRFSLHESDTTLLGLEIPSKNGKFYPLPLEDQQELARLRFDQCYIKKIDRL